VRSPMATEPGCAPIPLLPSKRGARSSDLVAWSVNLQTPARFCTKTHRAAKMPDGSEVVFAGGIYTVDAEGGEPGLVLALTREFRQDRISQPSPCRGLQAGGFEELRSHFRTSPG
jgi:hypothetical protein